MNRLSIILLSLIITLSTRSQANAEQITPFLWDFGSGSGPDPSIHTPENLSLRFTTRHETFDVFGPLHEDPGGTFERAHLFLGFGEVFPSTNPGFNIDAWYGIDENGLHFATDPQGNPFSIQTFPSGDNIWTVQVINGSELKVDIEQSGDVPATPEPTTLALFGIGAAAVGLTRWQRRKAANVSSMT